MHFPPIGIKKPQITCTAYFALSTCQYFDFFKNQNTFSLKFNRVHVLEIKILSNKSCIMQI